MRKTKICDHVLEHPLPDYEDRDHVFNDMSHMCFPCDRLDRVPCNLWTLPFPAPSRDPELVVR